MKTLQSAAHSCAVLSCAAALLFCAHAAAQQRMYKCVDDKGKVYYTQVPPKECLGKETDEISRQGRVIKRTEPARALTPEEQAAREEERKKKHEQEIAAREERRKNQALLNTYSSEKDLEDARGRALKDNEAAIQESEKRIAGAEKRKKELDAEKEFYVKKPMPPKLAQNIKNNEVEIRNQRELLEAKKKQVANINAKYDEDKRRYLELTKGAPASASKSAAKK